MRIESVFLLALMLLVPSPLVEPAEAVSARSQPCGGSICINEVMPNPNGYDDAAWPNGEWLNYTILEQLLWMYELVFLQQGCKDIDVGFNSIVGYDAANASTYTLAQAIT